MRKTKLSLAVLFVAAFCLKTSCGTSNDEKSLTKNSEKETQVQIPDSTLESKKIVKTKKEKAKEALVITAATVAGAATAIMIPKALPKVGKALNTALDSLSKARKLPRGILERADSPMLVSSAQALDNLSDDIIHLNGQALTSKLHQLKRIESDSFINSAGKRTIVESKNLLIRTSKDAFVIQVTPSEKDVAGRLAPVVLAGKIPKQLPKNYAGTRQNLIIDELNRFLKSINRTIADTEMNAIKSWLADLY